MKKTAWFGFGMYMVGLVYFLFISEEMGRSSVASSANLVPFHEIKRSIWLLKFGIAQHKWFAVRYFILNFVLNIVAFMPYGLFFPVISKKHKNFFIMFLSTIAFTGLVEAIQLRLGVGVFDVDDMMLNLAGGILGYFLYRMTRKTYIGIFFHKKKEVRENG